MEKFQTFIDFTNILLFNMTETKMMALKLWLTYHTYKKYSIMYLIS